MRSPRGGSGVGPRERLEIFGEGAHAVVENQIDLTFYRRGSLRYGTADNYIVPEENAPQKLDDAALCQQVRETLARLSRVARILGARLIRVYSFGRGAPCVRLIEELRAWGGMAKATDITLAVENEVAPAAVGTATELEVLLNEVDHPAVRANRDIDNGWRSGELPTVAYARLLAGKVAGLHIKGARPDRDGAKKFGAMALPGADAFDHVGIFRALKENGFDGVMTMDPHYGEFRPGDQLRDCAAPCSEIVRRSKMNLERILVEAGIAVAAAPSSESAPTDAATAVPLPFPWGQLRWLCNETLAACAAMAFGLCDIAAGQHNPRHYHPNCEEIVFVSRGKCLHELGGRTIPLRVGQMLRIPIGAIRCAHALGGEPLQLVIAFSRADRQTVAIE